MKRLFISAVVLLAGAVLLLFSAEGFVSASMPPYRDNVGSENYTEKITGLYLVEQSAAHEDNLIIYGSSELRTTEIPTHPSNFFSGKRSGFQVNLVGRGSCQSLIHAISIAATGDSLRGKKVVLITSPQSYIPQGIAPDLFMANFSAQQYLTLMQSEDLPQEIKAAISSRVMELFDEYETMPDSTELDTAIRYLAEYGARRSPSLMARNMLLSPYYMLSSFLYGVKDQTVSRELLLSLDESLLSAKSDQIDWTAEEASALTDAKAMTSNNDFGMLNDYYTTYIGTRLDRQKNKDSDLDYSVSKEYDDLRLLFKICKLKGIDPLFIHVPLHGDWSDYTGFPIERRREYYRNVLDITEEFGVNTLDLTTYEYEDYFLCDVMHLGWKGWLEVDRALIDYYYGD